MAKIRRVRLESPGIPDIVRRREGKGTGKVSEAVGRTGQRHVRGKEWILEMAAIGCGEWTKPSPHGGLELERLDGCASDSSVRDERVVLVSGI